MAEIKRKGARSAKDIPETILEQLNRGRIETVNLTEWLAVDQRILLENLLEEKPFSTSFTNNEIMGCPRTITYKALEVLMDYPAPTNAAPLKIAVSALALVKSYLAFAEKMFEELDEAGELSLGLNDFLAQSANTFEGYAYLLQQRVKTEMDQ